MNWGTPPWTIDFRPEPRPLPASADFAVIGGGFSGLAAAAWLRKIAPQKSVILLEASQIGSGASGRTGGLALSDVAVGPLEGTEDALETYRATLAELGVASVPAFEGVYEIGREGGLRDSPIVWEDSGTLRVVQEVPGGTVDAGRVVSGLARAAVDLGAAIFENIRVENIRFTSPHLLETSAGTLRAGRVLLATNAQSAALSGLAESSQAKFTLAVMTEPLAPRVLESVGLGSGKAFYTADLPYLWGRPMPDGAVMFGSGLVDLGSDAELAALDIGTGVAAGLFTSLEWRVRGLHPALAKVQFCLRWGGPIRFGQSWQLFFDWHALSQQALVLNGLGGDGVSFSVYLGRWAAETLAAGRELPPWGKIAEEPAD
jgi:glycine/D-amino acid oxidase-like deaminating enzyme